MSTSLIKRDIFPSAKAILSAAASAAATAVLFRSVIRDLLPFGIEDYVYLKVHSLFSTLSSEITITIDEFDGITENQLFHYSELYLGTKVSPKLQSFRASIPMKETKIILSLNKNQEVIDLFKGVEFNWRKVNKQVGSKFVKVYDDEEYSYNSSTMKPDIRHFELTFDKKHKDMVFNDYLPHIVFESLKYKQEKKTLKIHTLMNNRHLGSAGPPWTAVNLDHPSTFDTLAMDSDMKRMIMEDLELFVKRKEFYRKVGKAWKRGYLLYGPPGTGKSSLIAAMANYLKFDIYDLDLASINNSELRRLILGTANQSILVVEDIDCSIEWEDRNKGGNGNTPELLYPHRPRKTQITLSGLLNFIDGLWSSCGDERIIIFTTNHKERLDSALLRPGRMDVHLHMSYCTPSGLKMLVSNYLGIIEHPLLEEGANLVVEAKATPAEIGEQLLKSADIEIALCGLVDFLAVKIEEDKEKARKEEAGNDEVVEKGESEDGGVVV